MPTYQGETLESWLLRASDAHAGTRAEAYAAVAALLEEREHAEALACLMDGLNDPAGEARAAAAAGLLRLDPGHDAAAVLLVDLALANSTGPIGDAARRGLECAADRMPAVLHLAQRVRAATTQPNFLAIVRLFVVLLPEAIVMWPLLEARLGHLMILDPSGARWWLGLVGDGGRLHEEIRRGLEAGSTRAEGWEPPPWARPLFLASRAANEGDWYAADHELERARAAAMPESLLPPSVAAGVEQHREPPEVEFTNLAEGMAVPSDAAFVIRGRFLRSRPSDMLLVNNVPARRDGDDFVAVCSVTGEGVTALDLRVIDEKAPQVERAAYAFAVVREPVAPALLATAWPTAAEAFASRRDAKAQAAVKAALRWLQAHQAPDGHWPSASFAEWCDSEPQSVVLNGAGREDYDTGLTGLALLALLESGHTDVPGGDYADTIRRGLTHLVLGQRDDGTFAARSVRPYVYEHAAATAALTAAYIRTGGPAWRDAAQRGLSWIGAARNPSYGWRYGVRPGDSDTSVTAWMVYPLALALAANKAAVQAEDAPPFEVDEGALVGARAWVERMTDPESGRVGYLVRGSGPARPQDLVERFPNSLSESCTGMGVWIRLVSGEDPKALAVRRGVDSLRRRAPDWSPAKGAVDMSAWFWSTHALRATGGRAWNSWRETLHDVASAHQRTDGDPCTYAGSWDPVGPWGGEGGRIYATSMIVRSLVAETVPFFSAR